jgi:hypothetical protein
VAPVSRTRQRPIKSYDHKHKYPICQIRDQGASNTRRRTRHLKRSRRSTIFQDLVVGSSID